MKLPVTIIGGYLGAGKTTLINHLLRHNEGMRLAVLVNEFGDLPIDADLIEAQEGGLISISGGCVCCAFGSDLIGALDDLKSMQPRPDHVLIEASGVALPASIATTVGMIDGLRADAVLVLADADQIRANAAHKYLHDTIERQLQQADILLVTKCDLVDADSLDVVFGWLRAMLPSTSILKVTKGEVPASAILGALPLPARRIDSGGPHSTHGLFSSLVLDPRCPVDADQLARALARDPGVTRAKGYVATSDALALIQVVGCRHSVEPASGQLPKGLVCIGVNHQFHAERIRGLLDMCSCPALPAGNT